LFSFYVLIDAEQGMDDQAVPSSMTDYITRHKLPNEGHFSYYFFCEECHRQIFSTLFGDALGPLNKMAEIDETSLEAVAEEASSITGSARK
jgi:hypothetical protein